jgi:type 1 glutamine amidotransferase
MNLYRTARFALGFLLAVSAGLRGQSQRPKVLFVANPMGSDNDVIRRSSPEVLSVAERYFDEISRDMFAVTITQNGADDSSHPSTRHFKESFEIADDIYQFKNFDAENTQLLLSLDPASLDENPRMNRQDRHLPISWARSHGMGRVFYTALGDWEATWKNLDYQTHLLNGIQWAMRDVK